MSHATVSLAEPITQVAQRIISTRAAEVDHYARLYPLLLGEMDEIMADWDRSTEELPWTRLEASEKQNELASVITRVIDCAMSPATRDHRVDALINAAIAHGACRRTQGMDVPSIFSEYNVIRSATWKQLRTLVSAPTSYDAIFVIDGLLSIASRGTVLGFHRQEMEALGRWEMQLGELKKTVLS